MAQLKQAINNAESVYVVGDLHGYFKPLNAFIKANKPQVILCCGDFGYWRKNTWNVRLKDNSNFIEDIVNSNTKIYWCDGNHEDHDALDKLKEGRDLRFPISVRRNIYYCPRGSTIEVNGQTILFMGGAKSTDKWARTEHIDWFEQETISPNDIANVKAEKVDVVISHTCPESVFVSPLLERTGWDIRDESREYLETILKMYKPKQWFFGHHHSFGMREIKKCLFTMLDYPEHNQWSIWYTRLGEED